MTNAVVYQSKSGSLELKADIQQDTIWANLMQISELFDTDKSGVSRHILNAKFATVQEEGRREVLRNIEYYSLDMILSVGYSVNS